MMTLNQSNMKPESMYPKHIAIIMDGNGRWAKKRFLPRTIGHRIAVKRVQDIIAYCGELNIEVLTLFAFGRENWSRPKSEVSALMGLFTKVLMQEVKKLHKNGVCLRLIGERSRLSAENQKLIAEAETLTANNQGLKLQVAIDYSGRWDIATSVKALIEKAKNGGLDEDITTDEIESYISQNLQTKNVIDVDLLIRTSGEKRISNFMLWQLAYSELYFTEALWPDFTREMLDQAIMFFNSRQRRFGKISEQIESLSN